LNSVGVELMKSNSTAAVELDGARFAVDLVQRQAHRDAHEERLRQFDAAVVDVQEVAVVQRLQTEIAELQIGRRSARRARLGRSYCRQLRGRADRLRRPLDELREVLGVGGPSAALRRPSPSTSRGWCASSRRAVT
jgi:hypothetical protein